MWVQSLGQDDPLEEGMATHSSIFAWRILWTEKPGWLRSIALKSRTLKWLSMQIHADFLNAGLPQTFSFLKNAIYNRMRHVMRQKSLSCVRLFSIPWSVACQAPLWDSPGKNTGVGCYSLLQGIFLTQGSNPGLLHCRRILYCLSHQESSSQV